MIEIRHIEVFNLEGAVRGMRNPMNSWIKSDSVHENGRFVIGANDLELMRKLFRAGVEHRKYARQIFVSMDINAPLYWWKEFDTYKVATTANSCSTMHKLCDEPITTEDFSFDGEDIVGDSFTRIVEFCELIRKKYLKTKDKAYWRTLVQILPGSFNQMRTVTMDYETVFSIIRQRAGHKLDEWNVFVNIMRTLPYIEEIIN